MPNKLLVAALTLCVTSCATTNEVLRKDVDEVFHSPRPPAEVVACFEQLNNMRVIELADGTRVAAFRNGYGGVVKAFSIKPEGTGSLIESRHSDMGLAGRWKRCVGIKPMPPRIIAAPAGQAK
jgi:hypothetical protein